MNELIDRIESLCEQPVIGWASVPNALEWKHQTDGSLTRDDWKLRPFYTVEQLNDGSLEHTVGVEITLKGRSQGNLKTKTFKVKPGLEGALDTSVANNAAQGTKKAISDIKDKTGVLISLKDFSDSRFS